MSGIFENLGIDSGIIIIILLILTIFLLVRNISMNMRLSRLERKYKTFMKGSDAQSLEKVFVRKFAQIDKLYDAKEEHDHDLLFIKKNLDKMFNKYGVEKYKQAASEVEAVKQQKSINGIVADEQGEPIIGASVLEKGTTNGTITDLDGRFTLSIQ